MSGYIKVWAIMITNFIFSISTITLVRGYALMATIGPEELNIILMEAAAGVTNGEVILEGVLTQYVFTNLVLFSGFVFIICLVLHFFLEPKLKVLIFPGSLCFLSVFFIQAAVFIINSVVPSDIPMVTQEFIALFFGKVNQASLMMAGVGMLLLIVSCLNIYQTNKNSKQNS